jgi:hypothetical protein
MSPAAPVPLPIPKNVVLIAMMEAAERQTKQLLQREGEEDSCREDDEEQFDLNRIISGMATMAGPCGTYAVRESTGLAVVHSDPTKRSDEERSDEEKKQDSDNPEPYALQEGQTVQVVGFEDGIARLARGEGYIVANTSQLVKGKSEFSILS